MGSSEKSQWKQRVRGTEICRGWIANDINVNSQRCLAEGLKALCSVRKSKSHDTRRLSVFVSVAPNGAGRDQGVAVLAVVSLAMQESKLEAWVAVSRYRNAMEFIGNG